MLQKMRRIQVIGPKNDFEMAVDILYHQGTVHLENVSEMIPPEEITLKKVERYKGADIASILFKIGSIFFTLPVMKDDPEARSRIENEFCKESNEQLIDRANKVIEELEWTTKDLALRKNDQEFSITALNRYEKAIEKIRNIEHELPVLEGYEVNILIIQKEYREVLDLIKKELREITNNHFEFVFSDVDDESIVAITVFNKKYSGPVHAFIFSANLNEVRLPPELMGMTFNDMLKLIDEKRKNAQEEIKQIDIKFEELSNKWYQELFVLKGLLEDINEEVNTFNKFGQSDYIFVIMGWIPQKYLKKTKKALDDTLEGRVVIEELKVTPEELENAPTFYDNPIYIKPFEFFMQLVRPPKYTEVDPSPLIAVFFPIFFGLMVGDIGYGLVILILSLIAKKMAGKAQWIKDLANIMIISSFSTMFFGFLFGEFFGDLGEHMGWLHPMHIQGITLNRIEAIIPMLMLVIAIGIFHVLLGVIIGLINAITLKSKKHIIEKIGLIWIIVSLTVIALIIAETIPGILMNPAIALLLLSIPLIIYGGGIFGTVELVSMVGNILSYARLMAIGMASVILAVVANKLGGSSGVLLVGVLVAVMLHSLNIALAMFSPSIHALRLHMVEFFSKFYEGGGVVYKPFKKSAEMIYLQK